MTARGCTALALAAALLSSTGCLTSPRALAAGAGGCIVSVVPMSPEPQHGWLRAYPLPASQTQAGATAFRLEAEDNSDADLALWGRDGSGRGASRDQPYYRLEGGDVVTLTFYPHASGQTYLRITSLPGDQVHYDQPFRPAQRRLFERRDRWHATRIQDGKVALGYVTRHWVYGFSLSGEIDDSILH